MKKIIFASVCLLMAIVTFAEGKPALAVGKEQKEYVTPVSKSMFTYCTHKCEGWMYRSTLESHITMWKASHAQSVIVDIDWVEYNETTGLWDGYITYTADKCLPGEMLNEDIEVKRPQLDLKP